MTTVNVTIDGKTRQNLTWLQVEGLTHDDKTICIALNENSCNSINVDSMLTLASTLKKLLLIVEIDKSFMSVNLTETGTVTVFNGLAGVEVVIA